MKTIGLMLVTLAALMPCTSVARAAQKDTPQRNRLHSPATVRGTIGGESHNSYVIRAESGQVMTVQISWRRSRDNRAEFTVSRSADFSDADPVASGHYSDNGKRWSVQVAETGDFYIFVVAHPVADYTLRVT